MKTTSWWVTVVALCASSCATSSSLRPLESLPLDAARADACGGGRPMRVHFFDVRQALAALVELPSGERILVDTGDSRTPKFVYERMERRLETLLRGRPLDALWITHQHADHMGRAVDVLKTFKVKVLVDNGTYGRTTEPVARMRAAAREAGTKVVAVSPSSPAVPVAVAAPVTLSAVLPSGWSAEACKRNPNDCSVGLRIDYCDTSVLFTGDAEASEEESFTSLSAVTLLQAPHHGSSTSSSAALLDQVRPRYVVISSGEPREGTNTGYCHPSRTAVRRLAHAVGGASSKRLISFKDDELRCSSSRSMSDWDVVPVGEHLYSTARDGHVTFTSYGDGSFTVVTEATR